MLIEPEIRGKYTPPKDISLPKVEVSNRARKYMKLFSGMAGTMLDRFPQRTTTIATTSTSKDEPGIGVSPETIRLDAGEIGEFDITLASYENYRVFTFSRLIDSGIDSPVTIEGVHLVIPQTMQGLKYARIQYSRTSTQSEMELHTDTKKADQKIGEFREELARSLGIDTP